MKYMGLYLCKDCGLEIIYPDSDKLFYKQIKPYCQNCYLIISNDKYPINMIGGNTLFSPMATKLGDGIMSTALKEYYLQNNENETVIFSDSIKQFRKEYRTMKYQKIFLSNTSGLNTNELRKYYKNVYWFNLINEINALAQKGIYPKYYKRETLPDVLTSRLKNYNVITIHIRNLIDAKEKNMTFEEMLDIYKILENQYNTVIRKYIVFIGNDIIEPFNISNLKINSNINMSDFRNKLSLPQIAELLNYTYMFIGKDSGIAHLAAAVNCKRIFTWGYKSKKWFPKSEKSKINSFVGELTSKGLKYLLALIRN